jgi:hypothetical protein
MQNLARVASWLLLATAHAQDLFLRAATFGNDHPRHEAPAPECPPLNWIKKDLSSGAFIVNYTDKSWGAYMKFLNVAPDQWANEFNASDIWQYAFQETTFVMNHTIPGANFHLLYEASLENKWEHNPYPYVTPAGFDRHVSVNLSTFRNVFEKPGVPHPDSCWALRTDMPVVSNLIGVQKEYVVSFWRELRTPEDVMCTLYVYDAKTGEKIEPWKSQMRDVKPFPGYSYRYFRRTVQSFDDVLKRLKCVPTGKSPGTYFC